MNVILIGFSTYIFAIGIYELRTGRFPSGEIKWLNTPLKVRISAGVLLLIATFYLLTHMASSGMEYMGLVIGGVCGYISTSDKKHQDKKK